MNDYYKDGNESDNDDDDNSGDDENGESDHDNSAVELVADEIFVAVENKCNSDKSKFEHKQR